MTSASSPTAKAPAGHRPLRYSAWALGLVGLALLWPLLAIVASWLTLDTAGLDTLQAMARTVLPRYALTSLSFFIFLSLTKNLTIKLAIAVIFVILHIIMLAFFIQGFFIS